MKLSRQLWSLISIGCLLVAAVIIFSLWSKAVDSRDTSRLNIETARKLYTAVNLQKSDLNSQITQIEITIKQGQTQIAKLQTDLTQAEQELKQAKSRYPATAESIEYNEYLLNFAKTTNLSVLTIQTSEANLADISTNTDTFYNTAFTVNLKGKINDILSFVDLLVKDQAFKTGSISSVTFNIPVPLTQDQKDEIKASLKASIKANIISSMETDHEDMVSRRQTTWDEQQALYAAKLAATKAGITPYAMLVYTEQAIMSVVGGRNPTITDPQIMTTDKMAADIRSLIGSLVGPDIANQYTPDIVDAIQQEVADRLIDLVSGILGQAIGDLFVAGTPELTPQFGGVLGSEITVALEDIPPSLVGGKITELLKIRMQAVLDETIAAFAGPKPVEPPLIPPLDAKVVEQAAEEKADKEASLQAAQEVALLNNEIENSVTLNFNLAVITYKGS